ncbi:metal ABC transporter ATP-binding protein [Halomonas sp. ML-15]|uniref:metal ABC transporter ATP-binding protein n=1 Tax=Halomonas sp. ML-15 TaxID=2773305 RepID=UPI001746CA31|nr:metal ABC transporter ATP-binding protein [Halomonas sp. ML-15]MBD3897847.1 metal ABC transporter ATP-binding protein [Halomonas sp. ML-15]
MTDTPAIEARRLCAAYHRQPVLTDITLALPAGQWTAIVGPNGAGKSSLLKVVTGSLQPLSGELRILGGSANQQRRAGKIAYMAQQEQMEWDFPVSVRETVMTGRYGLMRQDPWWQRLMPDHWANPAHRRAVEEALEAVDMRDHAAGPIGELSGGQKKRVMLARALAQQADILLLDEPLAGVDPPSERLILDMLERERRAGRTIIMVTHDLPSARRHADQVALINQTLVGMGPPAEMLSDAMLAQLAVGVAPRSTAGGVRAAA